MQTDRLPRQNGPGASVALAGDHGFGAGRLSRPFGAVLLAEGGALVFVTVRTLSPFELDYDSIRV